MSETILVFGGAGQLGQELQAEAVRGNIPLVAIPREAVDISNPAAVAAAVRRSDPLVVINAAAYTKVDLAERETDAASLANAIGPGVVAQVCHTVGVPMIHVSTDYVFDGTKPAPYVEEDPVAPLSVYGRTKEEGERAVRAALPRHVILRTNWIYGRYGTNFLKTIVRLAAERDELRIVADQWGNPTATADLAAAILLIAARLREQGDVPWGTYHFGGTGSTSWHGFATEIVAALAPNGRRPNVTAITTEEYPTAARRPANSRLESRRFATTFGLTARPWQDRTAEVVAALLAQS